MNDIPEIGFDEEVRTRAFVAGLPASGGLVFVGNRLLQDFVRDLVRAMHGVRGCEATSIYVAPTEADETPFHIEDRRPVFRHPGLVRTAADVVARSVNDEPRVPRRAPVEDSPLRVSLDALRDWSLPGTAMRTWTLPVTGVRVVDGEVSPLPSAPHQGAGDKVSITITRGDAPTPYQVVATTGPFRVDLALDTVADVQSALPDIVHHFLRAA